MNRGTTGCTAIMDDGRQKNDMKEILKEDGGTRERKQMETEGEGAGERRVPCAVCSAMLRVRIRL